MTSRRQKRHTLLCPVGHPMSLDPDMLPELLIRDAFMFCHPSEEVWHLPAGPLPRTASRMAGTLCGVTMVPWYRTYSRTPTPVCPDCIAARREDSH